MLGDNRGTALKHLQTVFTAGALGSLPDGLLLDRFLAGRGDADSSSAFTVLVERHGPMVLGVCRDVLHDLHDAEDAAQATFLILARNASSIRRADSLASWLFGVALRVAARAKAEAARRRAIELRGGKMKARFERTGPKEFLAELHEELNRLPERYRAPIVLCHLEGLSNEQAAGQLGIPVRTVQRRLAQGRERLRARLVRRGLDPAVGLLGGGFATHAASELWLEATVRAASGLAAGQEIAALASTAVAVLTQGTLSMMLIGRLKIAATGLIVSATVIVGLIGAGSAIAARRQAAAPLRSIQAGQAAGKLDVGKGADKYAARIGPWIKGVVVDPNGAPVGGARVRSLWTIQGQDVTTKADGTFAIPNDEPRLLNLSFLATADDEARQGIFRFDDLKTAPKDARTLVRIVLKPTRTVTVTVVDGRGMPVEGAVVSVLDVVFPIAEGRTDARGLVALRAPADAMTQWIVGYKSGLGLDYFENYRAVPAGFSPPPERARLVLNGARTVRVRAKDSSDKPVPGVDVVPMTVFKRGKLYSVNLCGSSASVRTDEQGIAAFDWFPSDVEVATRFALATTSYFMPKWPLLEAGKQDVTAHVLRFATISGKVTRPDGSPADGILVAAEGVGAADLPGSSRARTTADGSYKMALAPNQSYTVFVSDTDWAATSRTGVVIREGQPHADVDLQLQAGSLIRGRVTAGPASHPASGVAVILYERGPAVPDGTLVDQPAKLRDSALRVADTDSDGRYAFRVGPGEYELTGPREPGVETPSEPIKVVAGQDFQRDFQLPRPVRPVRLARGVVRAGKTDGPPIAGAIVVAEPIGARLPTTRGLADEKGRFEFYRPFDAGLVYARDPAGKLAGYAKVEEDEDAEVVIVAEPAAIARGRVVDQWGMPYKGISVGYALVLNLDGPGNQRVNRRRRRGGGMMGGVIGGMMGGQDRRRQAPRRKAGGVIGGDDGLAAVGQAATTDENGFFTAPGLVAGARCRIFANHPDGGQSPERTFVVTDTEPIDLGDIVLRQR